MLKPATHLGVGARLPLAESSSPVLDISGRQMNEAEYAALETAFGTKIVCEAGVYWRRVRPFFYRPLLSSEPLDGQAIVPPSHWPGGCQYAVHDPLTANSTMNFLVCDEPRGYSLESLGHNRRRLIKNAAKSFQIRPIVDFCELKEQGQRVYISFYQRTRYAYKAERASKAGFNRWVETLRNFPQAIVLGGYGSAGLSAVSVSYWVRDTLWYASLFTESTSLKQGVCELMFHELRRIVAGQPGIARMIVRLYQGGNSRDQYYLIRGCKLLRVPARFQANLVTVWLLKWLMPKSCAAICGKD